jgi:hypothetical protein
MRHKQPRRSCCCLSGTSVLVQYLDFNWTPLRCTNVDSCVQSFPTCTILDLRRTFLNVTTSFRRGVPVQATVSDNSDYGISYWKETNPLQFKETYQHVPGGTGDKYKTYVRIARRRRLVNAYIAFVLRSVLFADMVFLFLLDR